MTIRGEGNKNTQKTLHKSIMKSKKEKEWLFLMVTFTRSYLCIGKKKGLKMITDVFLDTYSL